ncbi:metallophosphoesterase [Cupriavidus numazuensis]|uniref:Calcineurin-like phosphoesterase domain-containing protein n=1 Tax=Cupriavidus numazuensis TaxID=221992 RepID=A0ABM8TSF2_9BURK|nr:metallophosphoesterase [Cupriavidus numazuensis]CAG2159214.1 hypothetical protein LMG26411_06527 [Cupriavidus numazuensis]
MKIQVASDLHLDVVESLGGTLLGITPAAEAEVLVLAGNIHRGCQALEALSNWPVPVIYVPGNREFYGTDFRIQQDLFRHANAQKTNSNVVLLQRGVFEYRDVRFVGTTLWTDFNLYGHDKQSKRIASTQIWDYRTIYVGTRPFQTRDALREHAKAVEWLDLVLAQPFNGSTVVITHHAPHINSLEPAFAGHPLNPAYASNLEWLFGRCSLWIHGHVQWSCDYEIKGTRIASNPRGFPILSHFSVYEDEVMHWDNPNFQSAYVIDVPSQQQPSDRHAHQLIGLYPAHLPSLYA